MANWRGPQSNYNQNRGGGNYNNYSNNRGGGPVNVNPWQTSAPTNMNGGRALVDALSSILNNNDRSAPGPLPSLFGNNGNVGGGGNNFNRNSFAFENFGRNNDNRRPFSGGNNQRNDRGFNQNQQRNRGQYNRNRNNNNNNQNNRQNNRQQPKKEDKKVEEDNVKEDYVEDEPVDAKMEAEEQSTEPSTQKTDDSKPKSDDSNRSSSYEGIPKELLRCFVCKKDMWDAASFENHVFGRAHRLLLDSYTAGVQLKANMLRENIRFLEMKEVIEHQRQLRHTNLKAKNMGTYSCSMCEHKFRRWSPNGHKKSAGHQKLRAYLHPKCEVCEVDSFGSRTEWAAHRLSASHLKKVVEKMTADGIDFADKENKYVEKEEDLDDLEMEIEDPELILDISDGMSLAHFTKRTPSFNNQRAVGQSLLVEQTCEGTLCKICHKLLPNEEAAQIHLKTRAHFRKFIFVLIGRRNQVLRDSKKRTADEANLEAEVQAMDITADSKRVKTEEEDEAIIDDLLTEGGLGEATGDVKMDTNIEAEVDAEIQAELEQTRETSETVVKTEVKTEPITPRVTRQSIRK